MREILFRAKSNYGNVGEWEYGLVARPHVTEDGIVTSYYFTKICENGWSSQRTVSANTIGQYTGLTDKNGKKIFEGDILRAISKDYVGDVFVGVVVLEAGSYQIKNDTRYDRFHRIGEISKWQDMGAGGTMTYTYEVIGNIHDNPELLKGGAE